MGTTLNKNWLTDSLIDLEYKKYQLLAYLSEIRKEYSLNKLYPYLTDLISHKKELLLFKKRSEILSPKPAIKSFNWKNLKIQHDSSVNQPEILDELFKVTDFAVPILNGAINEGSEILNLIEMKTEIQPVGIVPIQKDEGYIFLNACKNTEVFVYQYQSEHLFKDISSKKDIRMIYKYKKERSVSKTFEKIKSEIIKEEKDLPNPAVYLIYCPLEIPLEETFVPVARELIRKKIQ